MELVEAFTSIARNRYSKKEGDAESETEDERGELAFACRRSLASMTRF